MFIVISYLESGSNYARGCLMESWDSDLEVGEFDTREEAADWIAEQEAQQARNCATNTPDRREYWVMEGKCITDWLLPAKEALDILLEEEEDGQED